MAEMNKEDIRNKFYAATSPKIICVLKNYKSHCDKTHTEVPKNPQFFVKPKSAISLHPEPISIPSNMGSVHYEVELVVLIGEKLKNANEEEAKNAIFGYDIGIDVTNREIQSSEKSRGLPWTLSKCMDGFAVLTGNVLQKNDFDLNNAAMWLMINGETRQEVELKEMLFSVPYLLSYISHFITLYPGDMVFTGTPGETSQMNEGQKVCIGADRFVLDEKLKTKTKTNICKFTFDVKEYQNKNYT